MTPIDAYLADLRAALGDRLPPSVHEARLREARAHLLASAEEVGEGEAIRCYGKARVVADGLVRAHRGYDRTKPLRLALPLSIGVFAWWSIEALDLLLPSFSVLDDLTLRRNLLLMLLAIGFLVRVLQTRRWLAGTVAAWTAVGMLLYNASAYYAFGLWGHWTATELGLAVLYTGVLSLIWAVLNAFALGVGRLLDLRSVRHATGAR